MEGRTLLALDLATTMGWAEGPINGTPISGSLRLASPGASSAAIFGAALGWIGTRLQAFRPYAIGYEAPLAPSIMRGRTNANTARILFGLPAVVEATAYRMGVHNIVEAKVQDVRGYFIDTRRLASKDAKRVVMDRCRMIGHDVKDDNEADAIALWYYLAAQLDPVKSRMVQPLFVMRGGGDG